MFWAMGGAPFNRSIFAPYILNVTSGLKLSFFYDNPNECVKYTMNSLTRIWYVNWNGTCTSGEKYDLK